MSRKRIGVKIVHAWDSEKNIKECDFYYPTHIQNVSDSFYNNVDQIHLLRQEIRLREAWDNLKISLGKIPQEVYLDNENGAHVVLFQGYKGSSEFMDCLGRYIEHAGFPHRIYSNNLALKDVQSVLEKYSCILINNNKQILRGWAKKRVPRFVFNINKGSLENISEGF